MLRNTQGDWPSANGDVIGSRHAATETAISPATVGRLESRLTLRTDGANWATPVVIGDSLFLTDAGGGLRRVDRDSGATIWARGLADLTGTPGAQARTSVVVTDRLVITGDRAAGRLIAVDRQTGDLCWTCLLDDHPAARQLVAATVAAELCRRLYAGGIRHFHFYTLNRAELAFAICHMLGHRATPKGLEQAA